MSENIIAICLYIGIMLMAGTVLVLTVVYFVKPGSNKKIEPAAAAAETVVTAAEPAAVTAVPNIKKRSFNIRSLKITAMREKPEKANIPVKKPGKPEKPEKQAVIAAATKPPEAEMKDTAALVENKKTDDKVKAATPAVETKKQENKVVVPAKEPAAAIPENNGKTPKAAAVKPEKEVVLNNPPQPVVGKSEKPEEPLSKEVPKVKVILPAPTSPKPAADIIKPKPDANTPGTNEKANTAAVEAGKKETELRMDNKTAKPPTNATVEKPKTTPDIVKPAAPVTTAAGSKKAPEQKSSLNEFSSMFSKDVVEDSEATKLAKDLNDVEINSLLKDGQDLVNLLKRGRS